ncbi:glycogen synthase GlgA [Azohydromonas caseinilytica]|uniref:Glycogen synthase n=1 Tax=Azohydromonas caseinilytica TaxID=2728836 RepID=A0A848F8Z4_9BURK|nr:glycogen synthase GlgA [Azohydromonas caseinilytica]NML16024.1 glycogen synthase GlgA [Azohydromonas caseinilytica]
MRVLQVSAELFPLLKTGGLADVAGALPGALARAGAELRVLLPGFPSIVAGLGDAVRVADFHAPWGERATLLYGHLGALGGQPAYVVDAPALYQRPGNPYQDEHGHPYGDNHRRFALLGWAAARLALGLDPWWSPRIVHSHDWHAALVNAYLAFEPVRQGRVGTVYTVHNLAYQGLCAPHHLAELGLPASAFAVEGLEFHGQVSFMKAGLYYADHVTTVSPSYAREIQTPEQGCGLQGLLRRRATEGRLSGILNGVDQQVWDPAADAHIARRYDAVKLAGKAHNRAALQKEMGLEPRPGPLFGMVSRLAEQKGLPLLVELLPQLVARGGQLVTLGAGDGRIEAALRAAAAEHPEAVAIRIGYDEAFAHRIFAGSDVTLVPSLYEPCGLTQLYGLRYGSLPLVRRVGGLADTVVDCTLEDLAEDRATGFVFDAFNAGDMERALRRAFALFARPNAWKAVQRRAMAQHFGWDDAAAQYLALYRALGA